MDLLRVQGEQQEAAANAAEEHDYIFALDIGTRSVIGLVGLKEQERFRVLDCEIMEHPQRAMIDGQIEDISQVAKITEEVKNRLEQRLQHKLTEVCVAAAGRALTTRKAEFSISLNPFESITTQQVYELEIGAVENAYAAVEENDSQVKENRGSGNQFYCVGYSVIRYYLDDYPLVSLHGHKGNTARVEIIATFLPNGVVESLYETMGRSQLNIRNLTLEPIAAMNAVIPAELRLLNLALVDIGAGTSDIAIADGGSVSAYTMATIAGDEITEGLIQHYLVDFQMAEKIKRWAEEGQEEITYIDVLGYEYTISREEALAAMRPAVENLATVISQQILDANGKSPVAVFLVGGGSKVPMLKDFVAEQLGLDQKKVAVGGSRSLQQFSSEQLDISGPEFATPVGIALTAVSSGNHEGFYVFVNGAKTRVFRSGIITVMDVLLMCGYKYNQLVGRVGKPVQYKFNGELRTIRGGYPEPAVIMVNDEPAGISTSLKCGDQIKVVPCKSGEDAQLTLREIVPNLGDFEVSFNGVDYTIGVMATVNQQIAQPEQVIEDRDDIQVYELNTLGSLCARLDIPMENRQFLINGQLKSISEQLYPGDVIYSHESMSEGSAQDEKAAQPITEERQEEIQEQHWDNSVVVDHGQEQLTVVYINQHKVELLPKANGRPYQFLDMLNYVDIDPNNPEGKLILRLNDRDINSYMTEIMPGDRVDIGWER